MVDLGQLATTSRDNGLQGPGRSACCCVVFTIVCDCSSSMSFSPRGYHPTVDCTYHHTAETCEAAIYMCTTPSSSSGTYSSSTPLQNVSLVIDSLSLLWLSSLWDWPFYPPPQN